MTFVFFTFTLSPRSTQNCWSVSNYCCSPTSDFDIKVRSFVKSNYHTCKSVRASALHYLPSKCPSRASKYSPNNKGLRGQPYFTPCWHLSWTWHLHFSGWFIRYPWHTLLAGIEKSIPSPRGHPIPATTFHMAQYRTSFWSPQSNNRVASFLPCSVLSESTIWKVGQ
jgi:hypothetical protein